MTSHRKILLVQKETVKSSILGKLPCIFAVSWPIFRWNPSVSVWEIVIIQLSCTVATKSNRNYRIHRQLKSNWNSEEKASAGKLNALPRKYELSTFYLWIPCACCVDKVIGLRASTNHTQASSTGCTQLSMENSLYFQGWYYFYTFSQPLLRILRISYYFFIHEPSGSGKKLFTLWN